MRARDFARRPRAALATVLATAAAALGGCATPDWLPSRVPKVEHVAPTAPSAQSASSSAAVAEPPAAAAQAHAVAAAGPVAALPGAIFQAETYRPLFENHRARIAGDLVTIQIVEKVSATQRSTSAVDRNGQLKAGITALPFLNAAKALARASAAGSSGSGFDAKGTTESSNDFAGTITASVVAVLPNGHLVVAGEKQIGVNANVDVLRFSGQVDPRSIAPGNVVASTQIANVRVEQRSRGQQADAQVMGWLGRFFLNVLPI